jgi:hypothetical protein
MLHQLLQSIQNAIQPILSPIDNFVQQQAPQRHVVQPPLSGRGQPSSLSGSGGSPAVSGEPIGLFGNFSFLNIFVQPLMKIVSFFFNLGIQIKKSIKNVNPAAPLDEEDFGNDTNKEDGAIFRKFVKLIGESSDNQANQLNEQLRKDTSLNKRNAWSQLIEGLFNLKLFDQVEAVLNSRETNAKEILHSRFGRAGATYSAILNNLEGVQFDQSPLEYQRANAEVRKQMVQAILEAETRIQQIPGTNPAPIDEALRQRLADLWNGHVKIHGEAVKEIHDQQRLQLHTKQLAERLQNAQRELKLLHDQVTTPVVGGTPARISAEISSQLDAKRLEIFGARTSSSGRTPGLADQYSEAIAQLHRQNEVVSTRTRRPLEPVR